MEAIEACYWTRMIRIFGYEFSIRRDTNRWFNEDADHVWEYTFRIEWLSPQEKAHRLTLMKQKYETH